MSRRFVTLGSGRRVPLGAYVKAWRAAQQLPTETRVREIPSGGAGTAGDALREFRDGMHDRINRCAPGYGAGRKWSDDWQASVRRARYALRARAPMERDAPAEIKARLPHRVRGAE